MCDICCWCFIDLFLYLYILDIVHRDLKLDNILLAEPTEELSFNIKVRFYY